MNEEERLALLKAKLGITTSVRDTLLTHILVAIYDELVKEKGLALDEARTDHMMFIVDYAEYRYNHKENPEMPRHLQYRLHNLMISARGW